MPAIVPEMPGIKAPPDMTLQYRREVARLINRGQNINFPGKLSEEQEASRTRMLKGCALQVPSQSALRGATWKN